MNILHGRNKRTRQIQNFKCNTALHHDVFDMLFGAYTSGSLSHIKLNKIDNLIHQNELAANQLNQHLT